MSDELDELRQVDLTWRGSRDVHRGYAKQRREAIRQAHAQGLGYGAIAKVLGVSRGYVQKVCAEQE